MRRNSFGRAGFALLLLIVTAGASDSRLIELEMASDLVPSPVKFSVVLPPGYERAMNPFPPLLNLHGGGGNRDMLKAQRGKMRDNQSGQAGLLPLGQKECARAKK